MQTKFSRWVMSYGKTKLAKELNCTTTAIEYWLRQESVPSLIRAEKITRLSKGKITVVDILKGVGAYGK